MNNPLVVNLFAGPGAGKSTLAAGLFYKIKMAGVNAELVTEYAKDKTWEESWTIFDNQIYIYGKQYHRQWRLTKNVDIIITDSPLLLSCHYANFANRKLQDAFLATVYESFNEFNNLNFFVGRVKPYNPKGRSQTLEESKEIDESLRGLLKHYNVDYHPIKGDSDGLYYMLETIKEKNPELFN